MRCNKVQKLLSDLHNGELSPRVEQATREHISVCGSCQVIASAHEEMMVMLGDSPADELPADFDARLHQRLVAENVSLTAVGPTRWRPALRSSALVLAGAAAVALFFYLYGSGSGVAPTPAVCAAAVAGSPGAAGSADQEMRLGEIAVVTLAVEAGGSEVELEVVLPDGLTLVGENHTLLQEKVITWTARLDGDEPIRIPVKAERPGTWVLVARARVGDSHVTSKTTLLVSPV